MNKYEFSLLQEVLLEKGAGILGDIFRYSRRHEITAPEHPITELYGTVWRAKQDILRAKTEADLAKSEAEFDRAASYLAGLELADNEREEMTVEPSEGPTLSQV